MTKHSIIRTEERACVNESTARRLISKAKESGLKATNFSPRERKYLESKEIDGRTVRYYSGYCFIFSKEFICITMFPVPKWFGKKMVYQGKERIRNPKKFIRNNPNYFELIKDYCIA